MKKLIIDAKKECLEEVMIFLEGALDEARASQKEVLAVTLAAEEIFANIASYAYADAPEKAEKGVEIEVETLENPKSVTITFKDRGIPFDPLKKEDPDITLSAEDREIGGLGVFLVKKYMEEVSYEYSDGQNILVTKKYLKGAKS